ncbi:MAG: tRNA dihydrouridine(20/20a) synthase DusA [Burkholderiales bacterium]
MSIVPSPWRLSVAPMMDWTDRHCRYFHRLLTKRTRLYTEMVTTGALIHGDRPRHLNFNVEEHPVALQLGGSDAADLATCAKLGQDWGYDEINLNCGCPSERVQRGSFGASLMSEPALVADCVKAMADATTIAITVKHRIGIDAVDQYGFVRDFVGTIADAGCNVFIAHARNAILKGLSPKENREIPPLKYQYVYQLKRDFPHLTIVLNGGVTTTADIHAHLAHIDGVMVGREAYHNPYWLSTWDHALFGEMLSFCERGDIEAAMEAYIAAQLATDHSFHPHNARRHMVGLYKGLPGARAWRRKITGNTIERVAQTLAAMEG